MVKVQYLCRSEALRNYRIFSPIGLLTLTSCNDGVHVLHFDESTENKIEDEKQEVAFAKSELADSINGPAIQTLEWLKIYFENPAKATSRLLPNFCFWPKDLKEASFTSKTWQKLTTVSSGEIVTYAELADLSGNAKACRAVGQAMRTNPVCLMIPCHRVVPRGSGVGNYANGRSKIKEWLIQHESLDRNVNIS